MRNTHLGSRLTFHRISLSCAFAAAASLLTPVARADEHKPNGAIRPSIAAAVLSSGETSGTVAALRREQEQLNLENSVAEQRVKKELAQLAAEKQRLELENSIAQQRLQSEITAMHVEAGRLAKQVELLRKRADLREAERSARLEKELAEAREKIERAKIQNELATAELAQKRRELELREMQSRVRSVELQAQRAELEGQVAKLNTELDLREKRDFWKSRVNVDIQYTKEPFKDGILTISDRRIKLNGPIVAATAQRIAERIHYFNNQSREYPIFIVIDSSPGGSVQAGYHILKTMQGSAAPVYVVVKSFAASMAAGITTLAKRSFAYPNAILLHHQMSGMSFGNMTDQREQMKEREEWWRRLAMPIAAKMGISLDDFVIRMYQHRASGDWKEFADAARKLKWVDAVVDVIREESYNKNPDAPPPSISHPLPSPVPALPVRRAEAPVEEPNEQVDANGHHYIALPRLDPVDAYYLFNPDGYYRPAL